MAELLSPAANQSRGLSIYLSVLMIVRLSQMHTDGGGGISHWLFGPH